MTLDALRTGCVIRFPFLWVREAGRGETEGRKLCPVAVGVRIARPNGEDILVLFPITSQPPSADRFAAGREQRRKKWRAIQNKPRTLIKIPVVFDKRDDRRSVSAPPQGPVARPAGPVVRNGGEFC